MTYILKDVLERVERALWEKPRINLEQLAPQVGISRYTIERATRELAGLQFRAYREDVILQKTQALITSDKLLSRKEVAFAMGFQSVDAFARFIKRRTGYCFSDFRCVLSQHGIIKHR